MAPTKQGENRAIVFMGGFIFGMIFVVSVQISNNLVNTSSNTRPNYSTVQINETICGQGEIARVSVEGATSNVKVECKEDIDER